MTPTPDPPSFMQVLDWAWRVITIGGSALVYFLERDRKQKDEAITGKFAQFTKDLEALRSDMRERVDRMGKQASDYADTQQEAIGRVEARMSGEHAQRRADVDRIAVDLGRLQLAHARQDEKLKSLKSIVERRELTRREDDKGT